MESVERHDRRQRRNRRWLRWLSAGLLVVGLLLAIGGWLRGQEQWGPFSGQLVDEETGAPIAGANVMVSWRIRRFGLVETLSDFFDAREAVTDAEGRFTLPRLWRLWTIDVMAPGIGYFAPGYVPVAREVTPPNGAPFVDPTVVKMRPLTTRQERCLPVNRVGVPLHEGAPLFRDAIYAYDRELRCFELEGTNR